MVIEHLFPTDKIRKSPWRVAALGFVFVCVSVILADLLNQQPVGFFIVALTVIPAIPFFLRMTICGVKGEEMYIAFICSMPKSKFSKGIDAIYTTIIELYAYFFVGCIIGFAFTSSIMPAQASQSMFSDLQFTSATAPDISFWGIFSHNFELMLLMLLFSLVYSVGAIFLLVLNAAEIGLFLQTIIRQYASSFYSFGILSYPAAFVAGSLTGILRLLPHGIWEFSGFFFASVAGGIISVAVERGAYNRKRPLFKVMLVDVAKLLILATLLLAAGAFIESSYPVIESILPSFLK